MEVDQLRVGDFLLIPITLHQVQVISLILHVPNGQLVDCIRMDLKKHEFHFFAKLKNLKKQEFHFLRAKKPQKSKMNSDHVLNIRYPTSLMII